MFEIAIYLSCSQKLIVINYFNFLLIQTAHFVLDLFEFLLFRNSWKNLNSGFGKFTSNINK